MALVKLSTLNLAAAIIILSQGASAQQKYTLHDLGTLGGTYTSAAGINNSGQVAGTGSLVSNTIPIFAFRTAPNSPINPAMDNLGAPPGGANSSATGINDSGQVTGGVSVLAHEDAFRTAPGGLIDAASLLGFGGAGAIGNAINNSGRVAGESHTPNTNSALVSAPNGVLNMNTFINAGGNATATGINNPGQVVGWIGGLNVSDRQTPMAFRTTAGPPFTATSLGVLFGCCSEANAINDAGQVVGISGTIVTSGLGAPSYHAFRTAPNSVINPATDDLGTLGGILSTANGINSSGVVVGSSAIATGVTHAFVFASGVMSDLNNLIVPAGSPVTLTSAASINDLGQIAATGVVSGETHAFRLDPIKAAAPPVTTAIHSPAANVNGWNNTNVTVTLHAADSDGLGVKQIQYSLNGGATQTVAGNTAVIVISTEGHDTLSFFATGNSGAVETAKSLVVAIDKTPPVVSGLPFPGCSISQPDDRLVTIATVNASDAVSHLFPGSFHVTATSNEKPGKDVDIIVTPTLAGAYQVQVRAERNGDGAARTYTVNASATDWAGNHTALSGTCVVRGKDN